MSGDRQIETLSGYQSVLYTLVTGETLTLVNVERGHRLQILLSTRGNKATPAAPTPVGCYAVVTSLGAQKYLDREGVKASDIQGIDGSPRGRWCPAGCLLEVEAGDESLSVAVWADEGVATSTPLDLHVACSPIPAYRREPALDLNNPRRSYTS